MGLERLKRQCERYLSSLLEDENAIYVYQLSEQYHAPTLLAHANFYILSNLERLTKLDAWKELDEHHQTEILKKASRWGFRL